MALKYITFDPFYEVNMYNEFITAAKNNKVPYKEYISLKSPYEWFISCDEKDLPTFINFEEASSTIERFLVAKLRGVTPAENYKLLRRESDNPTDIARFITPKVLQQARKEKNVIVFRSRSKQQVREFSQNVKDTKIYLLSKTKKWGFLYITFNPYIKGFVPDDAILMDASGKEYNKPGEIENHLNYKHLITEKIEDKTIESEYYINGKFHPLKNK